MNETCDRCGPAVRAIYRVFRRGELYLCRHCTNQLRAALVNAVTPDDIKAIAEGLIDEARDGNVAAAHELFDRLFGKAKQALEVSGKDGKAVKVKHLFDFERFAAELVNVQQERTAATGRMVSARLVPQRAP